mgnify:CR=1 FL=1
MARRCPDAAADHPANHGADVSAAAQTETPTGFDNHGQYVRSIANREPQAQTVAAEPRERPLSQGARPHH